MKIKDIPVGQCFYHKVEKFEMFCKLEGNIVLAMSEFKTLEMNPEDEVIQISGKLACVSHGVTHTFSPKG